MIILTCSPTKLAKIYENDETFRETFQLFTFPYVLYKKDRIKRKRQLEKFAMFAKIEKKFRFNTSRIRT
jgi:hypothetical protein